MIQAKENEQAANKAVKFMGINHLALVTGDMDKTVRFYRDVMGMPLVATVGNRAFRHYFFDMGQGNTIAFFEWPGITTGPAKDSGVPAHDGRHFDHLSFCVESLEALHDLQERLRAHGVDVTRVVDHNFIQSIYFDDPNGISLEASYWVVDVTQSPVWGDANPVPAVKEQMEREK